ncbi:hypothetical protein Bca52824_018157 [Brassica carinata]|uniref:Uncharacterized protein n=1 Tax=Brassica carinata TaxID=52824 RepID=A0A8X7VPL4_BRACI|nr:hypothetical protein Bca52824_018157 [Brassica carinata]
MMSYAYFLSGSIPSSSSPGLGSPTTQDTSVPQTQPAPTSIIEDRLLNELLVAPGREFLPKLSPYREPYTSWFRQRNRNAICKSILKCFHSLLDVPYPTYAHVPLEVQKMWLRSLSIHNGGAKTREEREIEMTAERGGVPPDWLELMRDMHTNKQTGEVQDPVARELLATLTKLKEDKETQLQQSRQVPMMDLQLLTCCPTKRSTKWFLRYISTLSDEKHVPVKKGRRYGIGRVSEGISTSSSQPSFPSSGFVEDMERMKTELVEERIKRQALEEQLLTVTVEERTKRQALEEQLRDVTTFISNLYPEQFSATQSQPESETQSPEDPVE